MKSIARAFLLSVLIAFSFITAKGQCTASFTYTVNGPMVDFSDTIAGTIGLVTYFWDFGNGDTSNVSNPSYPSFVNGSYYVCLTITDSICSNTFCDTVVVGCNASFTSTLNSSSEFVLTNNSTGAYSNSFWDFDDGNTSTMASLTYNYVSIGLHNVCLTINDSNCNSTYCDSVSVECAANFSYTSNGNLEYAYTNISSGPYATSFWDFNNGNTSNLINPIDTFFNNGSYNVCLTISDSSCNSTFCDNIIVAAGGSCASSFTYSSNGQTIDFISTSTSDSSAIINFWNFGDGFIDNTDSVNSSHNYTAGGVYNVSLYIMDTLSGCTDTVFQTVNVPFPTPGCTTPSFTYYNNTDGSVSFYNSTPSGYIYTWDLGNGSTAVIEETTIGYTAPGTYYVCLSINDSCNSTFCDSVTVTGSSSACSGNAAFTFVDNGGGSFSFSGSSNLTTNFSWDFGDGIGTSNLRYPNYNFASNGTYIVELTAYDSMFQCTTNTPKTIIVSSVSAVCGTPNFTYIDNTDGSVSFFNSSTNGSSYFWDFGNGNTSTQTNPTFHFQPAGNYSVCLTINDSCNNVFCDSIIVTDTTGTACSGSAAFTFVDNGGGSILFTNTSSLPTSYSWDFGDGIGTSLLASPNYTYATDGNYAVTLTVSDSALSCSETSTQLVIITGAVNLCSMASFTSTDNGTGLFSFSNTSSGLPTSYVWNFGDGTQTSGSSPNHLYTVDGIYVVALTVFDSVLGCSNSTNSIITVSGATGGNPCNAAFVVTYDTTSSNVLVYNTSTGLNITYYWDFGDGNFSTSQNPNYTYSGSGPYGLCLTVDNGNGCTSTYCDSIFAGGTVLKQTGFSIAVITPVVTSIFEESNSVANFNIYPNPAKDNLIINFNLKEKEQVEIFITDVLGNRVAQIINKNLDSGNNKIHWKTAGITKGIYLINIKTDNSLKTKKLILN